MSEPTFSSLADWIELGSLANSEFPPLAAVVVAPEPASVASAASAASAAEKSPINPRTILSAEATPGVQLIQTVFSARLAVPKPVVDDNAIDNLFAHVEAQAMSGQISADEASITNAIV